MKKAGLLLVFVLLFLGSLFSQTYPIWTEVNAMNHGPEFIVGANYANKIDVWVDCNYSTAPCTAKVPFNQTTGDVFVFKSREFGNFLNSMVQREHWQLIIKNSGIENVINIQCYAIGPAFTYNYKVVSKNLQYTGQ